MRIYLSSTDIFASQNKAGGGEPNGLSIKDAFSFYEYTWDGTSGSKSFSADMSYINDWAYPIQSKVNGVTYGFVNATGVAHAMAALPPENFVPKSAANKKAVGNVSDLYDAANRRFIGPLSIWVWQASESFWTQKAAPVTLPKGMAAGWAKFGADVPWGPMPWGGKAPRQEIGLEPSSNASELAAGGIPRLPVLAAGVPRPNGYPSPTFGFDFTNNLNWKTMNGGAGSTVDPSGDSLFYGSNFNVWNFGYAYGAPDAPPLNYAPDDPANPNAYTSVLRDQARLEGGMHPYVNGNKAFVGFYTFPKDDYNANYMGKIEQISLTVGRLASASTGSSANDAVVGTSGNDVISGGYGADLLAGGATPPSGQQDPSRDVITRQLQGRSRQALPGSDGQDVFVYVRADSSLTTEEQRDVITDFDPTDRIDLAAIDANTLRSGQQEFSWIGRRQFSGTAGQLRIDASPVMHALLQGDVDGNGKPDFEVKLLGVDLFTRSNLLL
ncbi:MULTISPECIES: M10 family metallopeptidase C-terminal domain-containing protein [unclassified Synechococcus]|uniref:M10 family metallopeptidase C-terminal domain-containing protein n=1 Tax=unclassified Synechococcus TaxID=2626047 RepID=UPI0021A69922|nr:MULTISPECIES: hypothetical protein [unclassified Synechococcus]MCT0213230.1 hypothetical protein [Synechococcus sp. CS-1326]MCT0231958.1 hypothetical protein [Synechococcus sp. CS-1327]